MYQKRYKVKVLSGYRITIPMEVRERFGIKVGQELEMEVGPGEIKIVVSRDDPVFGMLGIAEGAVREKGDDLFAREVEEKLRRGRENEVRGR
ncbi:MAG: AbrB/MazE/SpoVT family DNA-binding domain-containing protein [Candidatus Baldrarchaeia archaeon]